MVLAPWRSPLARALHLNRSLPNARYVQLATVRENGHPANRTVVFRGFLEETNRLQFITDIRSQKIRQIQSNPWSEVCWYFPKTREQFRLLGQLTLVDETHPDETLLIVRQRLWQKVSDAARRQFVWPDPGQLLTEPRELATADLNPEHPVSNFCVLLLEPTTVDYLTLKGDPQRRELHTMQPDGLWVTQRVNP
jgi:PPOX class probable FMN-dependent enzyme